VQARVRGRESRKEVAVVQCGGRCEVCAAGGSVRQCGGRRWCRQVCSSSEVAVVSPSLFPGRGKRGESGVESSSAECSMAKAGMQVTVR